MEQVMQVYLPVCLGVCRKRQILARLFSRHPGLQTFLINAPEQIVNLLRKIEVEIANGKTTPQAAWEVGITEQTYYRWRREFGGLKLDPAKRLKELEKENSRLKRLVAELSLEKQVLREVAQGNF